MPSRDDWDQLKRLFVNARELPRDERQAYVERECRDEVLRAELLELLEQADDDTPFMETSTPRLSLTRSESSEDQITPIPATQQRHAEAERPMPDSIGPYNVREVLGRGGMGQVYLAEQHTPLRRLVALKILRSAAPSAHVLARFASERQALARLNHPGIAQVYDAGRTDDGQPFLAMEYVPGCSITEFCERHALSGVARLELAAQVCRAIHHCHLRGLLHRDIKPNNILVSVLDGRALPKVIDFGVAKALQAEDIDATGTRHGQLLGTPEYASPEQLTGDPDIDTRSDVWALGVVIHELLTGELPRDGVRLPADVAGLDAQQRDDLALVLECALATDREARFTTAEALGSDVERLAHNEPVSISPASLSERARHALRRHRLALAAAGVLLLGAALGLFGLSRGLDKAKRAEADARAAEASARSDARSAEATVDFLLQLFAEAGPTERPVDSVTAGDVLDAATARLEEDFAGAPRAKARLTAAMAATQLSLNRLDVAEDLARSAVEQWMALERMSPSSLHNARVTLAHSLAKSAQLDAAAEQLELAEHEVAALENPSVGRIRLMQLGAQIARQRGELREAAELLEAARAEHTRESSPELNEERLAGLTLMNLGQVYIELSRFAEAEEVLLLAEETFAEYRHESHPVLDELRGYRGAAMARQGKHEDAEAVLRDAIEGLEVSLGPNHMAQGPALLALLNLLMTQGRSAQAEPLAARLDTLVAVTLGPDHVDRVVPLHIATSLAVGKGDYETALRSIEEAIAISEEGNGPAHQMTLAMRMSHTQILLALGRGSSVPPMLKEIAELAREQLGSRHELAVGPLAMRATMLAGRGQIPVALDEIAAALDTLDASTDNTPDVPRALLLATRAALRGQSGHIAESQADALAARDILETEGAQRGRLHEMATQGVTQVLMRVDYQ